MLHTNETARISRLSKYFLMMVELTPGDRWLTPKQVAKRLSVSVKTLGRWRKKGIGPLFRKLGLATNAPVRYSMFEVDAYAEKRTYRSTSEYCGDDGSDYRPKVIKPPPRKK